VKFDVSYQQVYTWVRKHDRNGIEGLRDGRGHRKSESEMSELERLRYENRMLKAQLTQQQMEIDFLKKLEELERR
jgi:transposase